MEKPESIMKNCMHSKKDVLATSKVDHSIHSFLIPGRLDTPRGVLEVGAFNSFFSDTGRARWGVRGSPRKSDQGQGWLSIHSFLIHDGNVQGLAVHDFQFIRF